LVPKRNLRFAGTEEITHSLIMMLSRASLFNQPSFPRLIGPKIRVWIFPPPDLVALPISTENEV
jgi:hypothetical protein